MLNVHNYFIPFSYTPVNRATVVNIQTLSHYISLGWRSPTHFYMAYNALNILWRLAINQQTPLVGIAQ